MGEAGRSYGVLARPLPYGDADRIVALNNAPVVFQPPGQSGIFGISLLTGTYAIATNRMGNIPERMIDSAIYPTPAPLNVSTWYIKAE